MKCKYCKGQCIKKGLRNRKQKYQCKSCKKYQQKDYKLKTIDKETETMIKKLNNESVSISSISRLLHISKSSVQRKLEQLSHLINKPELSEQNQSYEIDELRTYAGNKSNESWVIYAINKKTGTVVDLIVGRRTKNNIEKVVKSVLKLNPKRIYTDGLISYKYLVPKSKHRVFQYNINKIERKNLNLRTHLKRLSRKTICYTKQEFMLESCLKLYFWG